MLGRNNEGFILTITIRMLGRGIEIMYCHGLEQDIQLLGRPKRVIMKVTKAVSVERSI